MLFSTKYTVLRVHRRQNVDHFGSWVTPGQKRLGFAHGLLHGSARVYLRLLIPLALGFGLFSNNFF